MREIIRSPSPLAPTGSGAVRRMDSPRFLGFGPYTLVLSPGGTGASWAREHALTSGPGDRLADDSGFFVYLRDLEAGNDAVSGFGPASVSPVSATWRPGRIRLSTRHDGLEVDLDVCVVPTAPAELRRVTLRNRSGRSRRIELISCATVVLDHAAAHASHPVFSKLFVQTEHVPGSRALVVRRRPRSPEDVHPWMVHALVEREPTAFETCRDRFLGRGRTPAAPRALEGPAAPGLAGNVLDPVVSLRDVVMLPPGEESSSTFVLGIGADRADGLALVATLSAPGAVEAAFAAAEGEATARLARAGIDAEEAETFETLAAAILWAHPAVRAASPDRGGPPLPVAAAMSRRRAPALPLALGVAEPGHHDLPALARAARHWRALGVPIETVVLAEGASDDGDVRVLDAKSVPSAERQALLAMARLVADGELPRIGSFAPRIATGQALDRTVAPSAPSAPSALSALELGNGYGGFDDDGREYVIRLACRDRRIMDLPPRPWTNVVANETFGFLVGETGAGTTWCGNSREHRLTEWSNDPVLDPHGDALWLRDDASGAVWSPLPGPLPGGGAYEVRHGFGYSRWRHETEGLVEDTTMFVPRHDPVRVTTVRLTNSGCQPRRLSLFAFARPVLGARAVDTAGMLETEREAATDTLYVRNALAGAFANTVAFAAVVPPGVPHTVESTRDRDAFFGSTGVFAAPQALFTERFAPQDRGGRGDPVLAHRVSFAIPPGATVEVGFLLGQGEDRDAAAALVSRYRDAGATGEALGEAVEAWRHEIGGVHIETPSRALDVLVNGWLPYQTVACRLWARTAFYQSGGAFGFRDQLQDAAALVWLRPERTREQILRNAAHQFTEGDVLHWWHPPGTRGLRTRFADDLLWLPAITAGYVAATGDGAILDERIRFLRAPALRPGEDEVFLEAEDSGESADLYEHCCRAIDRSLAVGAHGLPLFGTGDWNDGMNRVGREGRGESVWMAFFLGTVLRDFAPLCTARGDGARAQRYLAHRAALADAAERTAWDGDWYLRAYYDDGAPLGSHTGDECRIDALVQAWSVLSGMAPPERAGRAMDAVERHLVSGEQGLVRLLTPPFEHTPHDPGYIKGYVRGVRENGGQYTHAAMWVVAALAKLGRRERAARVLELLSPVHHSADAARCSVYQVEPYVIAADVYGEPPHVGRGGWTWYTGSAGWMYRVCLDSILGLTLAGGDELRIAPCIPADWPGFTVTWRHPKHSTSWRIRVRRGRGARAARLDGAPLAIREGAACLPLASDGRLHEVEVLLGDAPDGEPIR